ncbi:membrane-bound alkaline phosphatase-like [Chironomus tepperi]|uniref:membrane-bound alkaline phosphatase-like n=1 Tax=Chironomus tepperi TaxID=113505 RepID=UPI00391F332E
MIRNLLVIVLLVGCSLGDEYHQHHKPSPGQKSSYVVNEQEKTTAYWVNQAQNTLKSIVNKKLNTNNAKNVIMFLGDGMSFSTVAATRMYMGGEEKKLSFEEFEYTGFSKTYCVDAQVADSACTSTAYLNGIKTNYEVIGLNAKAQPKNCEAQLDHDNWTESILSWAQKSCKATGIVTTTRITHASPAGGYAHVSERDWENDHEVALSECDPEKVDDIAEQLIYNAVGINFKVILGGGRANFRNNTETDEENQKGKRQDGKNLINVWKNERSQLGKAEYVWNKKQLADIDYNNTEYLLGLFEADHMKYNLDVKKGNLENEPSLSDMTSAAIKMLQKEDGGYFLFIEGGMIDQAHHYNYAQTSLDETKEFSDAIALARKMTSEEDTLIVVTADHSHVFTYNGYPARGSNVLGAAEVSDMDNLPYLTLSYANGPGFAQSFEDGKRVDPTTLDMANHKFQYPATVPRDKDTHGAEDVGVYASGPMAHLFSGNYEQNTIPLIMAYIMKVGPYATDDKCASCAIMPVLMLLLSMLIITKLLK